MSRRTVLAVAGGALLIALAGVAALEARGPGFDPARWQALSQRALGGVDLTDNPRARMVPDLQQRLHAGMTAAEVTALLGEPDSRDGDGRWLYALGASAYGVDYEYFELGFDPAGRLQRFALTRG